jgi:hypothetical protein
LRICAAAAAPPAAAAGAPAAPAALAALQVGYPLVTVLVCLVDAENYTRQVESMADFLVKQMKVKEYRSGLT